ncbi:MAG: hypothetical protein ABI855_19280 [Bacteroidota bacterium]
MKSLLNQSNAMFAYDGDYSYLHKEESASASKIVAIQSKLYSEEKVHQSIYDKIRLIKARHQFYFSATAMLILLNLMLIFTIFKH